MSIKALILKKEKNPTKQKTKQTRKRNKHIGVVLFPELHQFMAYFSIIKDLGEVLMGDKHCKPPLRSIILAALC